jgi:hypothetical protein
MEIRKIIVQNNTIAKSITLALNISIPPKELFIGHRFAYTYIGHYPRLA